MSPFVGREAELARIAGLWDAARAGRGGLVLLSGEPGIGKTRLAAQAALAAQLDGATVLFGRCDEEALVSFQPFVEILTQYVASWPVAALRDGLGPLAGDLAHLVPAIGHVLPAAPKALQAETGTERYQLFEAVAHLLLSASRSRPIWLVLDDLHWADRPTLLLLKHVRRALDGASVLIVGTVRDIDTGSDKAWTDTLAELRRERLFERIPVEGLDEAGVAALVAGRCGALADPGLARAMCRETEGNPFLIEEVLQHLVDTGALVTAGGRSALRSSLEAIGIPDGVRELVRRRLASLSENCRRMLATASVIGRTFRVDVLELVGGLSGDDLLAALDEAMAASVVREEGDAPTRYGFAHALFREALYEQIGKHRRIALHRRIGESLERLSAGIDGSLLAELAYHFTCSAPGGDAAKALNYSLRASDAALNSLAYEEAAAQLENAIALLRTAGLTDEATHARALLALGAARFKAGERVPAKQAFLEAAQRARACDDAERLAAAALGFGMGGELAFSGVVSTVDRTLVDLLDGSLAALPEVDSPLRARVLARLGSALYWAPSSRARREELSREAVEMAKRCGDHSALADALGCRHQAIWDPDNGEERLAIATEMLQLAEREGERERALQAGALRAMDLLECGRIGEMRFAIDAHEKRAIELRQPVQIEIARIHRATDAILCGRFDEGARRAQEAFATLERCYPDAAGNWLQAQLAALVFARGEFGRLGEQNIARLDESALAYPPTRCAALWVTARSGREQDARELLEAIARDEFAAVSRDSTWLVAMTFLGHACSVLRDAERASTLYGQLRPHAGRMVVVGPLMAGCFGPVSHTLGLLAEAAGREKDAVQHFEDAIEQCTRIGAPPFIAAAQHALGTVLCNLGESARGEPLLEGAEALAASLGVRLGELSPPPTPAAPAPSALDALASALDQRRPDLAAQAAPDGTVTLVFSDMAGFSAMTERLGDRAALAVSAAHNTIVRERSRQHGGFELELRGDGFLLAFSSARRAIDCAVAIQRSLAAHNRKHPAPPIRVRIGIHTGEVLRDHERFFGKTVILTSRIAEQARAGEILVSDLVKQLVESAGDLCFGSARELALKGFSTRQLAYPIGESPN